MTKNLIAGCLSALLLISCNGSTTNETKAADTSSTKKHFMAGAIHEDTLFADGSFLKITTDSIGTTHVNWGNKNFKRHDVLDSIVKTDYIRHDFLDTKNKTPYYISFMQGYGTSAWKDFLLPLNDTAGVITL